MYWEDRVTRAQLDQIELILDRLTRSVRKRSASWKTIDQAYEGLTQNGLTDEEAGELIRILTEDV